jgi:hypothetical protein
VSFPKLQIGRVIETAKTKAMTGSQRARLSDVEARTILEVDPAKPYGMGRRVAVTETPDDAARLVDSANAVRGIQADRLRPGCLVDMLSNKERLTISKNELKRQRDMLLRALKAAQRAINSMKVEAETGAQGDEQMMLEAAEQISNEGLAADMAIRETIEKITGQKE